MALIEINIMFYIALLAARDVNSLLDQPIIYYSKLKIIFMSYISIEI